jgi:hypothetical protein
MDGHATEHIAATKSMIAMQKTFHYAENEARLTALLIRSTLRCSSCSLSPFPALLLSVTLYKEVDVPGIMICATRTVCTSTHQNELLRFASFFG